MCEWVTLKNIMNPISAQMLTNLMPYAIFRQKSFISYSLYIDKKVLKNEHNEKGRYRQELGQTKVRHILCYNFFCMI